MGPSSGRSYVKAGEDLFVARVIRTVKRRERLNRYHEHPAVYGPWGEEQETVSDYGPYGTSRAAQSVGAQKAKVNRWDRSEYFHVLDSRVEILKATPAYEVIRDTVITERSTNTKENTSS